MDFDVVIVGAGFIGMSCALAQPTSLRVAVIDRAPAPQPFNADQIDTRVFAITHASQQLFSDLGVWSRMCELRVSAYQKMQVWDGSGSGEIHFDCREVGSSNLGHIVENSVLQTALFEAIQTRSSITSFFSHTLTRVEQHDEYVEVVDSNGQHIRGKLLIAADGANSWIANALQLSSSGWDYQQDAIIATIKTQTTHQKTARQQFNPQGPIAMLPLANANLCSLVWSCDKTYAQELMQLSDDEFIARLNRTFNALGDLQLQSSRIAFALHMRHREAYVKKRVVLVGDAAHTIHPLAGLGANLGLADVAQLARTITRAIEQQKDLADVALLRQYERARKTTTVETIAMMEFFKRLFGTQNPLLTWLRNTGLSMCDRAAFLKKFFIRRAQSFI